MRFIVIQDIIQIHIGNNKNFMIVSLFTSSLLKYATILGWALRRVDPTSTTVFTIVHPETVYNFINYLQLYHHFLLISLKLATLGGQSKVVDYLNFKFTLDN